MSQFPYKIVPLNENIDADLQRDSRNTYVQVGPGKYVLPSMYRDFAEKYHNFPLRKDDVFIAGNQRTGTTMNEILLAFLCSTSKECVNEHELLNDGIRFFEIDSTLTFPNVAEKFPLFSKFLGFDKFDMSIRRIFKTHLPLSLLPKDILTAGCKVVYLMRNPKDSLVSLYHLEQRRFGSMMKCDFETFMNAIIDCKMEYTPFWQPLEEFWAQRHSPNLLIVFYEEYIQDMRGTIIKIARFLDRKLSEAELDEVESRMSFKNLEKVNVARERFGYHTKLGDGNDGFFRKGKMGQTQPYFRGELETKVDKWIADNIKRIGITLPYLD